MIITISGPPGSGKSTLAKFLATKLNAQWIYVGGIRRELARKKGMILEQLNEYALTHPETDVDIDKEVAQKVLHLEKQGKIVVVEGRTQYHFLPESIKIYMKVDFAEGARRIWEDLQHQKIQQERNEGNIKSLIELKTKLRRRQESDSKRYKKYYNLNPYDEKQYDIVIDTTSNTQEETRKQVLLALKPFLKKEKLK